MASPAPNLLRANLIGDETEHTWAYLRSPIWPNTGMGTPSNFAAEHNVGYPQSYDVDGEVLPLLKSFQFSRAPGISYAWNLPLGVNYVSDPTWSPPDPNPDGLIDNVKAKLCIGFGVGTGESGDSKLVYQGTINDDFYDPWDNVLGYDYNTTKAALAGTLVNVTCRFWPIPYVDEFTWDSFTATVPIGDIMFPENQDWSITTNRQGGVSVFVGSGNLIAVGPPSYFPPDPWTINWIELPS